MTTSGVGGDDDVECARRAIVKSTHTHTHSRQHNTQARHGVVRRLGPCVAPEKTRVTRTRTVQSERECVTLVFVCARLFM